jgi:hypothetical protein
LHSRRTQSIYCYDLRGTSELREHSLGEIMKGLKGKIVYERDLQRAKSIDIQVALCARMLTLHCISLCKWQRDQRVNKNQRETRKICPMSPSTAALEDRASCIGGEEVRGPRCISITGQLPLLFTPKEANSHPTGAKFNRVMLFHAWSLSKKGSKRQDPDKR